MASLIIISILPLLLWLQNLSGLYTSDFSSISLYNFIYKQVSKVLANHLKQVLPSIISKSQSVFMTRRLITDNIIRAYEVLHPMKTRFKGLKGSMGVKLDISKAYDKLEWNLMEMMLKKLGYAEAWILKIMKCVTSVSYAVLINGQQGTVISPTRGLHQGDLIFPYFYLLRAEGLSILLNEAERAKKITGVKVARCSPVNYVFFADDNMVFCRANTTKWNEIQHLLDIYEEPLGYGINKTNTCIFFGSNTSSASKDQILSLAGVALCSNDENYLELPMMVGKNKFKTFAAIKDNMG